MTARHVLYLAGKSLVFHRRKTAVLVAGVAVTLFLPLAVTLLVDEYDRQMFERARATPLVVGAKGNRYDLVLRTLYFQAGALDPVPHGLVREVDATGLGRAIPIHAGFTARSYPVVGTTLDYFDFRELQIEEGRLPGLLGEAVIGSRVAAELGLGEDGAILSDQQSIYDLSKAVQVRLRVVGVLAETGTADDFAVFVDVRTAWIMEGRGHGHQDVTRDDAAQFVLERDPDNVTANAAVVTYVEITPANADSFHFHGDTGHFGVGAVIVVPRDTKGATILGTRYGESQEYQALSPRVVVAELMGIVFRVKAFFDVNFATVLLSTTLFLALVFVLSARLRRAEFATLRKMGASRSFNTSLLAAEVVLVLVASAALAAGLAGGLLIVAPDMFHLLS